jgi:hypothetical protein
VDPLIIEGARAEAEQCEVTGRQVRQKITGKHVLPSELEHCMATGKRALKRQCIWSGGLPHPDDLRTCVLTGLPIH